MHVLPLPFGLALALIPRREADELRDDGLEPHQYEKAMHARERITGDIRHFNAGRYIV
ncbi:MAG: hypothetical protein QOK34_1506 [Gaiellaceae bacterium]|jgi:hypothetical protein|nr:hypothetical protein [Gaiellaceae bacterium]